MPWSTCARSGPRQSEIEPSRSQQPSSRSDFSLAIKTKMSLLNCHMCYSAFYEQFRDQDGLSRGWEPFPVCSLHALMLSSAALLDLPLMTDSFPLTQQELPGRIWEGKESVLRALAALSEAAPEQLLSGGEPPAARAVFGALLAALERPKASFRTAALGATERALKSLNMDGYQKLGPLLTAAVAQAQDGKARP